MNTGFRKFSEKEKEFVRELLSAKESNLSGLQVASLISKRIEFEGIYCNYKEGYVKIFKKEHVDAQKSYIQISDLCFFIEELEESGLVTVDTVIGKDGTIDSDEKDDFWIHKNDYKTFCGELFLKNGNMASATNFKYETFKSKNLLNLLSKYVYNKVVVPRSALIELERDGFLSRDEKQLETVKKTQKIAIVSLCLSVVTLITSVFMQKCCSTKIESPDLETIAGSTNAISDKMLLSLSTDTIQLTDSLEQSNCDTSKVN